MFGMVHERETHAPTARAARITSGRIRVQRLEAICLRTAGPASCHQFPIQTSRSKMTKLTLIDPRHVTAATACSKPTAVRQPPHIALHFGQWNLRIDAQTAAEVLERAEWFYRRVDEAVTRHGQTQPALSGMATTLTAAYSAGNDLFVAHVGHSRAYLFRDGALTQLTHDQTVQRQVNDTGRPAPVDRGTRDLRHILTDTIGGPSGVPLIHVEHFRLMNGDIVLLCTDGLTDMVPDAEIADALALRRQPDEQCQALIDAALDAGGEDNITALLGQYEIPRDRT